MIILDTSVLIGIFKNKKEPVDFIRHLQTSQFAVSMVTLAEMELGFRFLSSQKKIQTKEKIEKLIDQGVILLIPVDRKIASGYAEVQAELKKKGLILSQFDGLIAATAIVNNATLVASDRDFTRVEGLKLKLI